MSIESLISQCGGETNITRVLMPQGRLIFAIRDCSRVASIVSGSQIKIVLGEYQVEFPIPDSISPADLMSIGQQIGEKQRLSLNTRSTRLTVHFDPIGIFLHHRGYSTILTVLFIMTDNITCFINGIPMAVPTKTNTGHI